MIEISYPNVMNGLNKGIHMTLLCPTQCEADRLWRRGCELWYIQGFSLAKAAERSIEYGPGDDKISIRFKSYETICRHESWRGFRGIFLLHPDITIETIRHSKCGSELEAMEIHNERYLEKWRA